MKYITKVFALVLFGMLFLIPPVSAWDTNGTIICNADSKQDEIAMIPDGNGGAFIVWKDWRAVGDLGDIYVQRIDSSGAGLWGANGTVICSESNTQKYPAISPDGAGGLIILWSDGRKGDDDIYAQRVNSTGDIQWTPNGTAICTALDDQDFATACSDGSGNFFILWRDWRGTHQAIYGQKVDATGNPIWGGSNGTAIDNTTSSNGNPLVISDGANGVILSWWDERNGGFGFADIYAQRLDTSGAKLWGANGIGICTKNYSQGTPQMIPDGNGGVIIVWQDTRRAPSSTYVDIYAQRVNSSGDYQWDANGTLICLGANWTQYPKLCNDSSGNIIITWQDLRDGGGDTDIYAQKVDANGFTQWTTNGVIISNAAGSQTAPRIVADGAGGAIITWHHWGSGSFDVYAQRVDSNGNPIGTTDGVAVCTAADHQQAMEICTDGAGGAIIAWEDDRFGGSYTDIYASRVDIQPEPPIPGFALLYLLLALLAIVVIYQQKKIN